MAEQRDKERFDVQVEITRQMFDWETEKYEHAVNGIREWMGWVEVPSLDEWNNHLERLDLPVTFPGMARVGYAPFSPMVSRWAGRIPKHWAAIWPDGYFPETRDRFAYDSRIGNWSGCTTEPAMMQAKGEGDTYSAAYLAGTLKTTGRIQLVDAHGRQHPGYRAYLAVYARDLLPPPSSVPENARRNHEFRTRQRMNAFLGVVVAEVAIEPLLRQICQNPELELELYAGPIAETNRLNRLDQVAFADSEEYRRGLHRDYEVPWYGSRWTLAFRTTPAFRKNSTHSRAGWVAAAGIVLTSAVAGLLWVEGVGRRRAEELSRELSHARDELHAVQAARSRLQRNLHDAVLQRLYAAALHARQIWQFASRGREVTAQDLSIQVTELDEAMSELRTFLGGSVQREMTPEELGLALKGLSQAFARQTGVAVLLEVDPDGLPEFARRGGDHLIQMVREGLSNAWRHGHASRVQIRLSRVEDSVLFEVEDDGSGFDPATAASRGLGLGNLDERAQLCGGTFEIDSRIGGPTSLRIRLPSTPGADETHSFTGGASGFPS